MAENGTTPEPNRIFLWIHPRSLSTSFEKCVGFMEGAQIWHEPYVTCYFNSMFNDPNFYERFPSMKAFANQFYNAKKLMEAGDHLYQGGNLSPAEMFNHDWVKEQLEKPLAEGKSFMFIKDGSFGIDGYYDKLPQVKARHTFLIRHPKRTALSVRRLLRHLVEFKGKEEDFEIGSGHPFMAWEKLSPDTLFKLWNYVRENIDPNPIVIDADDLQNHPEQILRKYCEAVGIPFKKKYLNWDESDESLSYDWVKEQLERPLEEGKSFMFIKDGAFGIDGHYDKLPEVDVKHTFIIRHPHRVALSVRRLLSHLVEYEGKMEDFDIGSGHPFMAWEKLSPDPMYKLWNYVRENIDPNPVVIDADDLQKDPEQMLKKYCKAVSIPFKKKYLKWEKSDESLKYFYGALDQLVWGKNEGVYDAAFLSSCFFPLQGPIPDTIPDTCIGYEKEFRDGYKAMYETRLKLD